MRTIDADALSELLVKTYEKAPTEKALLFVALLLKNNEQVPTVEPDRTQGEWIIEHLPKNINNLNDCYTCVSCSECGFHYDYMFHQYNFCPNCGAEMKGGTE